MEVRYPCNNPTKTFEKMKSVYSYDCLDQTQVFALHGEFSEGSETAKLWNSQHSGQPLTLFTKINVNTARTLTEDHFLTCWEMATTIDYSRTMTENIMKKFSMWCIASMQVIHHLTLGLTIYLSKVIVAICLDNLTFLGHSATGNKVRRDLMELLKLLTFSEFPIRGPSLPLIRLKGPVMDSALTKELVRFYEYSTIRACELNIRKEEEFPNEYANWIHFVIQFQGLVSEIHFEKIWLIT